MFTDKMQITDKISIVNNQHIPQRTQVEIVSIDRENETARVKYLQDNVEKFRTVEFSQICPSLAHLTQGLKECFETLIKVS